MKNPDRDDQHRRRREEGSSDEQPDGKEVAEKLFGVPADELPGPPGEDEIREDAQDAGDVDLDDLFPNDDPDE